MKYLIYILSIGALVGCDYHIATGITWSDIFCLILLLISIIKYLRNEWVLDTFAKYSSIYIPIMFVVALANAEISNTVFINFFRNYTMGVIVYVPLSNIICTKKDLRVFLMFLSVFLVQFMINYRRMMQDTFSENLATLDFGYGRNNVAFTALLFAILFEFLYYAKIVKSYILLGIVVMVVIITLCASRYAMMMLAISFFLYRIMSGKKFSSGEVLSIGILVVTTPFILTFIEGLVDSSFLESSRDYLNEKMANADSDFYGTRIIDINVKPIDSFINEKGILSLIIGDGISIQHSFFSHTLLTTGIIGLYVFVRYMVLLIKWAYQFKREGFFLFIVILTMYLNDFITNARFIINVNSIFYCTLCAIIIKYIQLYENNNSCSVR